MSHMKLPAGSLGTYILIVTKSTFVTAIIFRCRGERFFSFMLSQRSIPSYVERNGFCDGGRHLFYIAQFRNPNLNMNLTDLMQHTTLDYDIFLFYKLKVDRY